MWIEILLFFCFLFAWFYHYCTKQYNEFKKQGIPYAKPSFPFGSRNAQKVMSGKMSFFDLERDLAESDEFKNVKIFGYFMTGQPTLVINDEDLAKQIMIKDFDHFADLRPFGYKGSSKENQLYNHMLTSLQGPEWKKVRALLNPCFTSSKLKLMVPHLVKCGDQLAEYVTEKTGEDFEGRDLFGKYALDGFASAGYGLEINSFADPGNVFRKMALTMTGAPGYGSKWDIPRFMLQAIAPSIAKLFGLPMFAEKPCLFLTDIIEKTVKQRRETGVRRNDIVDLIVDEMKGEMGEKLSREKQELILTANALVLFFAGFDTISITMSNVIHKLILYPDVQQKLMEEIDTVLENDDAEITWEAIQKMKYLEQVIKEGLRFQNMMSAQERRCSKDYRIPDTNITIPKGRIVKVYFTDFETDEKNFKNPGTFDPENFSPENNHNKFAFMGFSQGPRNCIGMRYAMLAMGIGLISFFRKHKGIACEKTNMGRLEMDPEGIFAVKGGVWFKTEERSRTE